MTAAQSSAFQANGGFTAEAMSGAVLAIAFAVILLWGVWAMRAAYAGWAEQRLSHGQFLIVIVRFLAIYLVLAFFLLS